jgi:hypothetical protein
LEVDVTTLSNIVGSGPIAQPPIASGIAAGTSFAYTGTIYEIGYDSATNTTTSYTDAVNYSGSGVLQGLVCGQSAGGPTTADCRVTIDGVTVFEGQVSNSDNNGKCLAGAVVQDNAPTYSLIACSHIPFKTSLRVEHKIGTGGATVKTRYKYYKTR